MQIPQIPRSLQGLALLTVAACNSGPDIISLNFDFTVGNQSGFDFTFMEFCYQDIDALLEEDPICRDTDETEPTGFPTGQEGTLELDPLSTFIGNRITFDAVALDVDGDGYIWGPETFIVTSGILEVDMIITLDHCCYDL